MVESFIGVEAQGWIVAVVIFAMTFGPLWRFSKSLCRVIDKAKSE